MEEFSFCSLSDSFHSHMTSPPDPPLKHSIPLLSSFSHVYSSRSIVGILSPNLTHHYPYPYSSDSYCSIFTLFVSFFVSSFHVLCHVACTAFLHRFTSLTQHIASFVTWGFVYKGLSSLLQIKKFSVQVYV